MSLKNSMLCAIPSTFVRAVILILSKNEKGINVEDFEFFKHFQESARVRRKYKGSERYKEYFPSLYLIYKNYHKKLDKQKTE